MQKDQVEKVQVGIHHSNDLSFLCFLFFPTGIRKLSLCYKLACNFLKRENEKDEGKLRGNESDRCQSHEHESKKRLCNLGRNTSETNGPK